MKEKAIVIIPARGGSRGVPRKNLKYLNGKPLISYVINACKKARNVADIYVTTDNKEIAKLAKSFGAKIIDRPKIISTDEIQLEPAINHAVLKIEEKGISFELIATVQLTSPLLSSESIDNAIELLLKNPNADSVITVVNDPHLGWQKINNKIIPKYKERLCRQWLPDDYRETGGITCTRRKFITETNRLGSEILIYELSKKESLDINDIFDWKMAESILNFKSIYFIVNSLEGVKKSINLSDYLGGYSISFVSISNNIEITEKIKKNKFNLKITNSIELNNFLENKRFEFFLIEKDILKYLNKDRKNYKTLLIEDFTQDLKFDNVCSIIEKINLLK